MIFKITLQTFQAGLNIVKNVEFFDVRIPFSNQEQMVYIDCSREPLFAVFIHRRKNIRTSAGSS